MFLKVTRQIKSESALLRILSTLSSSGTPGIMFHNFSTGFSFFIGCIAHFQCSFQNLHWGTCCEPRHSILPNDFFWSFCEIRDFFCLFLSSKLRSSKTTGWNKVIHWSLKRLQFGGNCGGAGMSRFIPYRRYFSLVWIPHSDFSEVIFLDGCWLICGPTMLIQKLQYGKPVEKLGCPVSNVSSYFFCFAFINFFLLGSVFLKLLFSKTTCGCGHHNPIILEVGETARKSSFTQIYLPFY